MIYGIIPEHVMCGVPCLYFMAQLFGFKKKKKLFLCVRKTFENIENLTPSSFFDELNLTV